MHLGKAFSIACLAVGLTMQASGAELSPRGILVIDEFNSDSPFARGFRQRIHSTLDRETTTRYALYSESLDTAHSYGPDYEPTTGAYFATKYRHIQIGVIVALKQNKLDVHTFNLAQTVRDVVEILEPLAKQQDVSVQVDVVPSNFSVKADPVHIQQVLLNLAVNAIEAMQNVPASKRKLILRAAATDNEIVTSVEDSGTGIPQGKLKRIFGPLRHDERERNRPRPVDSQNDHQYIWREDLGSK